MSRNSKYIGGHRTGGVRSAIMDGVDADIPEQRSRRRVVRSTALGRIASLPTLHVGEHSDGREAPDDALRLPDVPEADQCADRHGDGGHAARLSGVGSRDLHPHRWHQGRVQHETAPRPRRHAYDRLVSRAPHPSDVADRSTRRSPAPSKSRKTYAGRRTAPLPGTGRVKRNRGSALSLPSRGRVAWTLVWIRLGSKRFARLILLRIAPPHSGVMLASRRFGTSMYRLVDADSPYVTFSE